MSELNNLESAYTCATVASKDIRFSVPIYQRLFVWGEEQVTKLFEDIRRATAKPNPGPYYIGALTVKWNKDECCWELVDGQQRLTFLSLFAAECKARKVNEGEWSSFLFRQQHNGANPDLRIAYIGRESDQDDLRRLGGKDVTNPNFREFHRLFEMWLKKMSPEEFDAVQRFVYTNVSFLFSVIPDDYSPVELNLFFERMNAAGRQLGLLDIVKGRWFPEQSARIDELLDFNDHDAAGGEANSESAVRKLAEILKDPDPGPEREAERIQRKRCVLSSELILLHVLSLVQNLNTEDAHCRARDIITEFDAHLGAMEAEQLNAFRSEFMKRLEAYRKFLDEFVIRIDSESPSSPYRLRDGKKDDERIDDEDEELTSECGVDAACLVQFESMLYVCQAETGRWVYDLYRHFGEGDKPSRVDVLKYLMAQDHADALPDLSAMTYGQIERKWFWRLDYILWECFTKKKGLPTNPNWNPCDSLREDLFETLLVRMDTERADAIRKYIFRLNRSIEHLHPQNATDERAGEWQTDAAEDSFGNLAMISSSFNSYLSNGQINAKIECIKDQIAERRLESIKLLVMVALAGEDIAYWTPEKAKRHGEAMYNLLQAYYSTPAVK